MVRRILLTQGKVALVDDEDYERVMQYRWHARAPTRGHTGWYVVRNIYIGSRKTLEYMHTYILGYPDCDHTDHVNFDTLDNRKENLRTATFNQSAVHRIHPVGISGYRGVYPSGRRWQVTIKCHSINRYLGTYNTPEEAARAFDEAARELHGEFAILNFPDAE